MWKLNKAGQKKGFELTENPIALFLNRSKAQNITKSMRISRRSKGRKGEVTGEKCLCYLYPWSPQMNIQNFVAV